MDSTTLDKTSLLTRDQAHLIHPLHNPTAHAQGHVWVKGEGAVLTDADGKEYIDCLAGLWNVVAGHGRRELAEVAARQMETLAYCSGYAGSSNQPCHRSGRANCRADLPVDQSFLLHVRRGANRPTATSRPPATTGNSKESRTRPKSSRGSGVITV